MKLCENDDDKGRERKEEERGRQAAKDGDENDEENI